jgi:hypothetical protein
LPEAKATILALFNEVEDAARAVSASLQPRSSIHDRFMDRASIRCSEKASPMGIPEEIGGLLLLKLTATRRRWLRRWEK